MNDEEKKKRIEITKTWIKKFENKLNILKYEAEAISSMLRSLKEDLGELEEIDTSG